MSISLSSDQLEFKLRNATHYSLGQAAASNKDSRKIVQEHKNRPGLPSQAKGLLRATTAQRRSTASPPGTGTTCGSA